MVLKFHQYPPVSLTWYAQQLTNYSLESFNPTTSRGAQRFQTAARNASRCQKAPLTPVPTPGTPKFLQNKGGSKNKTKCEGGKISCLCRLSPTSRLDRIASSPSSTTTTSSPPKPGHRRRPPRDLGFPAAAGAPHQWRIPAAAGPGTSPGSSRRSRWWGRQRDAAGAADRHAEGAAYRHGGPRRRPTGGGSRRRPPRPARGQRPGVCSLCSRSVDVMGMVMVAVVLGFWADLVGGLGGMG